MRVIQANLEEAILSTFINAQLYFRYDESYMNKLIRTAKEIDITLFEYKNQLILRMIRKNIELHNTLVDEVLLGNYFENSVDRSSKYYHLINNALIEVLTATPLSETTFFNAVDTLSKKKLLERLKTI